MTVVYGIKNCDTIKKTLKWLTDNAIEFNFHDYRKDGLTPELLETIETALGWEVLVNKRGTTYRQLSDEAKTNLDKESALHFMLENPALIKRPVINHNGNWLIGFKAAEMEAFYHV